MFPKIDEVCHKMNLYLERQLKDKEILADVDAKEVCIIACTNNID